MEEAFRTRLTSTAAVTAIVPVARISWGEHPQGTGTPYIVMMVVSDNAGLTLKGSDKLSEGRVQVDCYAPTYGAAKLLSRAVRDALHAYRDRWFLASGYINPLGQWRDEKSLADDDASGGAFIMLVSHVGTRDSREGGTNEAERLSRVSLDFTTAWRKQP